MERSRKWSSLSQLSVPSLGTTVVHTDLWSKSRIVKELETQSQQWINKQIEPFKAVAPQISDILRSAVAHYTTDFGFNKVMMLLKYLDLENISGNDFFETRGARKLWNEQDPALILNTRVMAHITANCSYNQDIVVYRGFKDRRRGSPKLDTKEDAIQNLKAISEITDLETEIKDFFDEDLPMDAIIHGQFDISVLKDPESVTQLKNLVEKLSLLHVDYNLDSRDVENLVKGIGEITETETFMSTSLTIEHARKFMDVDCCLLQITVPAGTPCFYVSPFSDFQDEENEFELVLPPCSRLIIQGRSQGITRVRYDGISDVAKHRLTLDTPRLWIIRQMVDGLLIGRNAANAIRKDIGLLKICRYHERSTEKSVRRGLLTTFSNDLLKSDWMPGDDLFYQWPYDSKSRRRRM
jgi:hypothetical protein